VTLPANAAIALTDTQRAWDADRGFARRLQNAKAAGDPGRFRDS
jgi:hypothetical protein